MRKNFGARRILRATWILAVLTVIVASLLPSNSLPMLALGRLNISDKIEHFLAYAVLAFLPAIHERRRFIIAAAIGAILIGIGLEYGQLYSGWRDFEVADMFADAMGVCFGLALGVRIRSVERIRSVLSDKGLYGN